MYSHDFGEDEIRDINSDSSEDDSDTNKKIDKANLRVKKRETEHKLIEVARKVLLDLGLKPKVEQMQEMLKEVFAEENRSDHETLSESILYQYAYLERLMQVCKEQKNPRSKSQLLITGKDAVFNHEITQARQTVERIIEMADEELKEYAEAND